MTDFEKLIEAEVNKVKGNSSTSVENHLLIRQFREAVWVCSVDPLCFERLGNFLCGRSGIRGIYKC
jgi:hypothetical protein